MKLETQKIIDKYKDNIFSVAFNICSNPTDAEDVVQECFIAYHMTQKQFEDEAHIRAWLIRVAINKAKNIKKSAWYRKTIPLEEYMESLTFVSEASEELFEAVMRLPEKYRIVIHLFYYEDYSIREISEIMQSSESNIKVRLNRGRKILKQKLQEGWNYEE